MPIDIQLSINNHLETINKLSTEEPLIRTIAESMVYCLAQGGKILLMVNGGSAADCQHLAAELVGRFERERRGLASIALTTDTSILTAIGNDYGYNAIFSRQIESICTKDDLVIGISTSGNSQNILNAMEVSKQIGAKTIAFTGRDGGQLKPYVDLCLVVQSNNTARIQEAHILAGHILCDWVEDACVSNAF
jgi:D-sedoheptulose 7-phosphate isomerase